MSARGLLLAATFVTSLIRPGSAGVAVLPEIPVPRLAPAQVLAIAQQRIGTATDYTLVGLDWRKSSDFQPRFSDGTQYSPADDQPDEYSWFVTYVYRDREMDEAYRKMRIVRRFNAVRVLRIKADGSVGVFIGARI